MAEMFKHARERIKRWPVIGPTLHRIYLALRYGDGRVYEIRSGPLQGWKLRKYIRSIHEHMIDGDYEPEVQAALVRHLRRGATFFDVGANGGFLSLLGAKLVGPSGTVVAFEPHPETARDIAAQVRINRVRNVRVVTAAVSDTRGTADLADDRSSDMLGLAGVSIHGQPQRTISVRTTTLDAAAEQHGVPDVVKVDVEGAELLVIQGGTRMLRDHAPILLMELHSEALGRQYLELVASCGYTTNALDGSPVTPASGYRRFVVSHKPETMLQ